MDTPVTSAAPHKSVTPRGSSGPGPGELDPFAHALLSAMLSFKQGDFSVRLPSDFTGVNGKIADAFNDIAAAQRDAARARRRAVTHAVGKEGKLKQRMYVAGRRRAAGPTKSRRSTR